MTDDEILEAAEKIKERRKKALRLDSFLKKDLVMIRWDVPYNRDLQESYVSVMIPREAVEEHVREALK